MLLAPPLLHGRLLLAFGSIGYAIAQRLGREGANLVVSSRRQENVDTAVDKLKAEGISVEGTVCNVSKEEHRSNLIQLAQGMFLSSFFSIPKSSA